MNKHFVHRYAPRGAARAVLLCRDDEVLLSGPAGTGKSRACLEKLHLAMLRHPRSRGLMVRKTATSLTSTALVTFREHVIPECLEAGLVTWYGGSQQESAQFRYANGSTINVGGMDKSTRIMSSEYDMVYVQEATELTIGDWEAITTRLRNGRMPYQQIIADCNPDTPTHWLKQRADQGVTTMLHSKHEDNPVYFSTWGEMTPAGAQYMGRLDALTGVRYERLRHGRWVAAEGAIYDDWDQSVHLVDRPESWPGGQPPMDWPRFWAIDWGFTNPTVIQRWAQDNDGRLWLYAETYRTRRTTDQHARDVLAQVTDGRDRWIEPKPYRIVADHDIEDRVVFERIIGIPTTAANKAVTSGIQAVQRRLRVAEDGRPRLYIVRDTVRDRDSDLAGAGKPICTADEIPGYVWEDGTKERPVKEDDHGMDALRYLVADLDMQSEVRVRLL